MNIRAAQKSDLTSIIEIYNNSKLDELRFESKMFELLPLEQDCKRYEQLLESDIYVYEDKKMLGYGALYGNEIRGLFVHPLARGKGVGSSLFEHLIKLAKEPTRLYVAKANIPAKRIYERFGFRVTREFETTYNGITVSANEMSRAEQICLAGVNVLL